MMTLASLEVGNQLRMCPNSSWASNPRKKTGAA